MTNGEKAIEIAINNRVIYDSIEDGDRGYVPYIESYDECRKSALEMAEWKDAQLNEELNLITDWFNHIAQIADDKKTANGVVMKDSNAFATIKCIAKSCTEYINSCLVTK